MISIPKEKLADIVHEKLLALRNIETLVILRDFELVFDSASEDQKVKARKCVDEYDLRSLRDWYKQRRLEMLGILSVRELRILGSQIGVPNYNKLTKPLLLSEIVRLKTNGNSTTNSCFSDRNEGTDNQSGCTGREVSINLVSDGRINGNGLPGDSHLAE